MMQKSKTPNISRMSAGLLAAILACAMPLSARAQDAAAASGVGPAGVGAAVIAQTKAQVIGIDAASNTVTLRGQKGRVVDVKVSPEVADVKKLQLGDIVNIQYRNSLLIHADKVKSNGIRERVDEMATVPATNGMSASVTRTQVLATIEKIDARHRLITLRGPTRTEVIRAAPDVALKDLKVGDSVRAVFETATAVQVTRNGTELK